MYGNDQSDTARTDAFTTYIYNASHNYGHGVNHLVKGLALLMLLAFLVDQIQQSCCQQFQKLWAGVGSKTKLREAIRSSFQVLVFESMTLLYQHIGYLYRIQME